MRRMFGLAWNQAKHSIGIASIDEEHRGIFERVNRIAEAVTRGDCETAEGMMDEFIAYTQRHFAREEQLMLEHGFPGLPRHKEEHDDLLHKVHNLKQGCHLPQAAKEALVLAFLTDWAEKHIIEADKEIGEFLVKKGLS